MALQVKTMAECMAEGKEPEILFWVGAAGAFDDRAKKITRSFVKILNQAGGFLGWKRMENHQDSRLPEELNHMISDVFFLYTGSRFHPTRSAQNIVRRYSTKRQAQKMHQI